MPADERQERMKAHRSRRRTDREAVRQGRDHAAGPAERDRPDRNDLDRRHQHRLCPRHRRLPARPRRRSLRPGVVGQDDTGASGGRRGSARRRHGRLRRCRARTRCRVRQKAWRRHRQPPGLAARQRRAGARNRRSAGALQQRRRRGGRLGGGPRAARRNRRRDGRSADGTAGTAHVASPAQAHRRGLQVEDRADLHQPAAREDRRDVRQPGDDHRRTGA